MDLNFGVFYTCYTEYDSVKYSLEELYKIYPDIPVLLISDGGSDYSDLESKFLGLKTILEHDSRGRVPKINGDNFLLEENQKYMKESIFTFLDRIKRSIDYCKKPYLLIMEPDVLVRGRLSIKSEDVHLLGSRVNYYHWAKDQVNKVLSKIEGSTSVTHYGATPAIFNCKSFMKVYDFFTKNEEIIEELCRIDSNFANYDILLTVLFAAMGFEEISNEDLSECLRNPNWENSDHPLLHQFRIYYPKSNYSGRHAIN